MSHPEILSILENCELFKGLEQESIDKIVELCRIEEYETGEYIFHQGDCGELLYIIAEGHVFLERSMDLGTQKGKAVIGLLGRGRAFGCWSTLLDEPHNLMSSAICKKDSSIVILNGSDLREIMLSNIDLGFKLLEKICFMLRDRLQGVLGAMEKI